MVYLAFLLRCARNAHSGIRVKRAQVGRNPMAMKQAMHSAARPTIARALIPEPGFAVADWGD